MPVKAVLQSVIEIVVMLFAAFGGFLTVVAPPPGANDTASAVGLASFVAVVVFVLAKLYMSLLPARTMMVVTLVMATLSGGVFVVNGVSYLYFVDRYTFRFPEGEPDGRIMLAAPEYAPAGRLLVAAQPELDGAHAAILAKAGEAQSHEIWSPKAVVATRRQMTVKYITMVLALTLCLGFAIEGLVLARPQ